MVTTGNCDKASVENLIVEHVQGASSARSHGKELSFRLPLTQSGDFPGKPRHGPPPPPSSWWCACSIGISIYYIEKLDHTLLQLLLL